MPHVTFRFILIALLACAAAPAFADSNAAFKRYLESLWPAAAKAGVSRQTFERATRDLTPDPEVLERAERQPEFKLTAGEYHARLVTEERVKQGLAVLEQYKDAFDAIERKHGVSRYILAAIWGVESKYGTKPGSMNVIRALATLGFQGRRRSFGRSQLLAALRILERGDISLEQMTGSWAGAMGHTQFIPTTYNAYAVDHTGDGKRDIWNSPEDALASAANYLKKAGWRTGETWGYEVTLPPKFNRKLLGKTRTAAQWQALGVKRVRDQAFPRPSDRGYLFAPEGTDGPVFLIIRNFKVLKRYNNADAYALAVGHLADLLAGGEPLSREWPSAMRQTSAVIPARR